MSRLTIIAYRDRDGDVLIEAAEKRDGRWCLAGCMDDVPLDVEEVIDTADVRLLPGAGRLWLLPAKDASA